MPIQAPNFQEARDLLELIAGEDDPQITFQTFDDKGEDFSLAKIRHGRLSDPELRAWLTHKAKEGCGVYYTANETDGKGRRRANMLRYRIAVADLDGAQLPDHFELPPDIIVESSPGRYHLIWLLRPGTDFNAWSKLQVQIATFFGADKRVFDPPRVFRLPGFYHQKSSPFRSKIVSMVNKDAARFDRHSLEDLVNAYECEFDPPMARKESGKSDEPVAGWDSPADVDRARYLLTKAKKPGVGDRNNAAYRMAAMLNDYAISPGKSSELLHEWNDRLDDPLPDHEIEHVIRSAPEYKASPAGSKSSGDALDDFADDINVPNLGTDEDWPPKISGLSRVGGLEYQLASAIKPESVKWLWPNRIPRGKVSLIGGFPNQGKSQILCSLAAIITTGGQWPNGEGVCEQGAVMILAAEDTAKDTLIPRLLAAGANMDQVLIVNPMITEKIEGKTKTRVLNIEDDLKRIAAAIVHEAKKGRIVKAILIDPLNAYYGGGKQVDSHNASEMRALLTPLSKWCGDKDVAVVGISHFNKSSNTHFLYRITDSAAITAVCRAVWFAVQDEEDEKLYLVEGKKNIGRKASGIEYSIDDKGIGVTDESGNEIVAPFIEWGDPTTKQAHEILGGKRQPEPGALKAAVKFVEDYLTEYTGPRHVKEIEDAALQDGIAKRTLHDAIRSLQLKKIKRDFPARTYYDLTEVEELLSPEIQPEEEFGDDPDA